MSPRTINVTERVHAYLLEHSLREPEVMRRLREETAARADAQMQISPEQGQFMQLLVELLGAKRTLEVGTFTGYSALAVALALPPDGQVIACDINPETTAIGRRYWEEAGVGDKIELRLAPAADTLRALIAGGRAGSFDFAFIDADKGGYDTYYEACLELLRPGGLIVVDNALWGGAVADPSDTSEDTTALRALNAKLHQDERVSVSLVPIGDGLYLARKR